MALTLIRRLFRKPQVNYVQLNVGGSQPLIYTKRRLARIMVDYQTGNSYIAEKFFDDSRNKRSPQVFFLNKFFYFCLSLKPMFGRLLHFSHSELFFDLSIFELSSEIRYQIRLNLICHFQVSISEFQKIQMSIRQSHDSFVIPSNFSQATSNFDPITKISFSKPK